MNSRARLEGLAYEVPMQIKDWKGRLDFIVMEMNDFDVILGQDFLKGNREVIVPFCNEVMLIGES